MNESVEHRGTERPVVSITRRLSASKEVVRKVEGRERQRGDLELTSTATRVLHPRPIIFVIKPAVPRIRVSLHGETDEKFRKRRWHESNKWYCHVIDGPLAALSFSNT